MRVKKKIKNILITSAILSCVAANIPAPVFAQIVPDGRTATTLSTVGNTTTVTTNSITGTNAFNSFKTFDVKAGTTANLMLPTGTDRLFNIVKCGPSHLDGVVNAYKNGQIGGNVYFANPHGIVVGAQGSINTGSLTAITPTKQFVDNFFSGYGTPNPTSVNALINGTAPLNPKGEIINNGTINTQNSPNSFIAGHLFENKGNIASLFQIVNVSADVINLAKGSNLTTDDGGTINLTANKMTVDGGVYSGYLTLKRKNSGDITINSYKNSKSQDLQLTAKEMAELSPEFSFIIGSPDTTKNINVKADLESPHFYMSYGLSASKDINLNNSMRSWQDISAIAGNKIYVGKGAKILGGEGHVDLLAQNSITLDKGSRVASSSGPNLRSVQDIIRANNASFGGYVTNITAKKDVNLTDSYINSADSINIKSETGNTNIKSSRLQTTYGDSGGINIDASRSVNIYCKSDLTTPMDIALSGKNVNISKDSTLNAGGQIIINKK